MCFGVVVCLAKDLKTVERSQLGFEGLGRVFEDLMVWRNRQLCDGVS